MAPAAEEALPASVPPHPPPLPLAAIIGHERALETVRASLGSGRIHHAWIFHGPVGVGKFTTALAVAAVLLDPTSAPDLAGRIQPDPDSRAQKLLRAGSHPDLHIVTKELAPYSSNDRVRRQKQRNIPVDVVREFLIEPATRTGGRPGAMASKVFIVDEAELLAPEGQNALLKTIEEPAPGTVIFLITSAEDRLLPTIRSRCQRVAFTPLSEAEMLRWLDARGVPQDRRHGVLRYAAGSPGAAQQAIESSLDAWYDQLRPMLDELAAGRYPLQLAPTMASLIEDWAKAWVDARANASKEAANKLGAQHMFRLLAEDLRARLRKDVASPAADRRLAAIDALAEAEEQINANVQIPLALDAMAARIAAAC